MVPVFDPAHLMCKQEVATEYIWRDASEWDKEGGGPFLFGDGLLHVVEGPLPAGYGPLLFGRRSLRRRYELFQDEPALFVELAHTPPTTSGIAAFASRYGSLQGEWAISVTSWLALIADLGSALSLWQALSASNLDALKQHVGLDRNHVPVWRSDLADGPALPVDPRRR